MHRLPLFIVLSALLGCGATQAPAPESRFAQIESQAEGLCVRSMEREEQHGLVVALYDHGEVWTRGYGTRSAEAEVAPDIDTIFEIASITKTYTALMLADMVERGEVRLDERLADLLPPGWTMHPSASEVTVEQVITHRSGLPASWPGFVPTTLTDPFNNMDETVLREGLAQAALVAPAGTVHAYNNFAVSVLGYALAHRLHMPFEEALQARVLGPLGLSNTWMDVPEAELHRFAEAIDLSGHRTSHWHLRAESPAGGLRASASDLLRYASAYLHPDALTTVPTLPAALRAAVAPRAETNVTGQRIGLAWFVTQDGRTTTHSGRTSQDSQLYIDRERELIVVVLATSNSSRTAQLARNLLALLRGEPLEPEPEAIPAEVILDDAQRLALVGAYQFGPDILVRIGNREHALTLQATGQIEVPLRTTSATTAIVAGILTITFEIDAEGRASALIVHQGSATERGVRCRDANELGTLPACTETSR